jgi:hypothetical protein
VCPVDPVYTVDPVCFVLSRYNRRVPRGKKTAKFNG